MIQQDFIQMNTIKLNRIITSILGIIWIISGYFFLQHQLNGAVFISLLIELILASILQLKANHPTSTVIHEGCSPWYNRGRIPFIFKIIIPRR
ncbi:hypothetical protein BSK61_12350 [Paenibacillus odorifer]|nr:hypothetical protein BSK61_12350 [Paenibacillus odorifer]